MNSFGATAPLRGACHPVYDRSGLFLDRDIAAVHLSSQDSLFCPCSLDLQARTDKREVGGHVLE